MNNRMFKPLCASLALLTVSAAAQADATHQFVQDLAQPLTIDSVSADGGAGVLDGARAYARFSDGHRSQASFSLLSGTGFQLATAQAAEFSLQVSSQSTSDSEPTEWSITNLDTSRTLVGFSIDGYNAGMGQAAFDINFGPNLNEVGTPISSTGRTLLMNFAQRNFIQGLVTVTYSHPLALVGAPAVGDLFAQVDVDLAYSTPGLNGGLQPNLSSFSFQRFSSDLDTVSYAASSPVPEPSAAVLFLGGLAALAWRRRKTA